MTKASPATGPLPLAPRARRLRYATYLLLVATVFTIPLNIGHIRDLHTLGLAETPNQQTLLLLTLADAVQSLVFIIAMALFIHWIWRAARNLERLPTPPRPTPTPMESSLCWFIPLLNVYWTRQVLTKILHGSLRTRADQWGATNTINIFWAGWLISSFIHFINYVPLTYQASDATAATLLEPAYAALAANAVAVVALFHLLTLTAQITQAQDEAIASETA